MANPAKIQVIKDLKDQLKKSSSAALVDYQGLSAEQFNTLRKNIKQAQGKIKVIKNSLITRTLRGLGIELPEKLTGQTAVVWSENDEIAPLKEVDKANKQWEKPSFRLGIYQNKLLSLQKLQEFVRLPSKEVLTAQFVGGLKNPLYRLVRAMKYNQTKLVLTLKALEKQKEEEGR